MTKVARRATTLDRGPPGTDTVAIHTVEQLGPNMSKLPNGSLLCANVPIARVGWMIYGPDETPVKVGDQGVAYVERTADTLFDPICVGSFMGAAVVDEHPDDDVTPENWKTLGRGFSTNNVRRGEGDDAEVLLADLIITDASLIASVLAGKREVSCGYDADYDQTADGVGTQTNIIGNHIALVEKGRCGPRCAIGDREFQPQPKKEKPMATQRVKINSPQRRAVLDAARQKVRDAEEELQQAEAQNTGADLDGGEGGGGDTHIHIHAGAPAPETKDDGEADPAAASGEDDPVEARFSAIESSIAALTEAVQQLVSGQGDPEASTGDDGEGEGEGDPDPDAPKQTDDEFPEKEVDKKEGNATQDSKALATSYAQVLAQAEVLVPGFRMPTFDAKAKRKSTVDAMCKARRKALDTCCATAGGQELVHGVAGTKTLDLAGMACPDVATLFKAAAGAKALLNNASATKDSAKMAEKVQEVKGQTLASINAANRTYWEGKK